MGDKEEVVARLEGIKLTPLEKDDDHYPIQDFINDVREGNFIDYDGFGKFATIDKKSNKRFYPSELKGKDNIPIWATHVVWYNR